MLDRKSVAPPRAALGIFKGEAAGRLPGDVRQYFGQLKRDYKLATASATSPDPGVVRELLAIPNEDATWSDMFALERAFAAVLPDAELPGHFATWRDRFRQIVGARVYDAYLATKPQDPADPAASVQRMRADLIALIDRMCYLYMANPSKERIRNRLSFWLSVVTIAAVVIVAVQLRETLRAQHATYGSHTLLIAVLAGVLGGFLSVQQRLQSATDVDPLYNRLEMASGFWNIIFVAPISGGIFAGVLYALFATGAVSGNLFPVIYVGQNPTVGNAHGPVIDLETFLRSAGPASGADLAKLLVWSFVAGFAERFVPDVLTRVVTADTSQPAKKV